MMQISQPETSEKKARRLNAGLTALGIMKNGQKLVKMAFFGQSSLVRKNGQKMPPVCSHQWIDLVDLAMHRAIVRKIRRQPKLFNRAKRTLERWQKVKGGTSAALREWKEILNRCDMETVLRILIRPDQEGDRLRSTAPFSGILKKDEAEAIWARYEKE